jgi:hypothetical protein
MSNTDIKTIVLFYKKTVVSLACKIIEHFYPLILKLNEKIKAFLIKSIVDFFYKLKVYFIIIDIYLSLEILDYYWGEINDALFWHIIAISPYLILVNFYLAKSENREDPYFPFDWVKNDLDALYFFFTITQIFTYISVSLKMQISLICFLIAPSLIIAGSFILLHAILLALLYVRKSKSNSVDKKLTLL